MSHNNGIRLQVCLQCAAVDVGKIFGRVCGVYVGMRGIDKTNHRRNDRGTVNLMRYNNIMLYEREKKNRGNNTA